MAGGEVDAWCDGVPGGARVLHSGCGLCTTLETPHRPDAGLWPGNVCPKTATTTGLCGSKGCCPHERLTFPTVVGLDPPSKKIIQSPIQGLKDQSKFMPLQRLLRGTLRGSFYSLTTLPFRGLLARACAPPLRKSRLPGKNNPQKDSKCGAVYPQPQLGFVTKCTLSDGRFWGWICDLSLSISVWFCWNFPCVIRNPLSFVGGCNNNNGVKRVMNHSFMRTVQEEAENGDLVQMLLAFSI